MIVDRALVSWTCRGAESGKRAAIQAVIIERSHFSAPVGKRADVAICIVCIAFLPVQRISSGLHPVHVVVDVDRFIVTALLASIQQGQEIAVRVVRKGRDPL